MLRERRPHWVIAGVAAIGVGLWPCLALADTGTALMWAGSLHLLVGNAIIGVIEGMILARFWRTRLLPAILIMIVGNYVAWWSYAFLGPVNGYLIRVALGDAPLWHLRAAVVGSMLFAFGCSLVLEAPFSYMVFRRGERGGATRSAGIARMLRGHLMAQSVTYVLLAIWYYELSDASLLRVPIEPGLAGKLPSGWLYFNDAEGRCARRRLSGGNIEACPRPRSAPAVAAAVTTRYLDPNSPWKVSVGDWATGLFAQHADGRSRGVMMQTPNISWHALYPTVLARHLVVYQLSDQIVVVDIERPAIAPLVEGKDPVVELD